jgi:pheromone shutdown-related protein TraB
MPPPENVVIVGTAHILDKSIAEVKETIGREKPDVVALELDPARLNALLGQVKEVPLREVLKSGKLYLLLAHWLLATLQRKLGAEVGVEPGAEMKAAYEEAKKAGAAVALIDRDVGITFQRLFAEMGFREKLRLFRALMGSLAGRGEEVDLGNITERSTVDRLVGELRKFSPTAARVLVDERDATMAAHLAALSRSHRRVVAVVGAGHREGIERYLGSPETLPPPQSLMEVRRRRFSAGRVVGIALFGLILAFFAAIAISVPVQTFLWAFLVWSLVTGAFAAGGAALAGAHPLAAAVAFGLAWFGVLHPLLATGWFSGLAQFALRPPGTGDFKELMSAASLKSLWRNRAFRVLMVAALTNVGTMVGAWLAGPYLVFRWTGVDVAGLICEPLPFC